MSCAYAQATISTSTLSSSCTTRSSIYYTSDDWTYTVASCPTYPPSTSTTTVYRNATQERTIVLSLPAVTFTETVTGYAISLSQAAAVTVTRTIESDRVVTTTAQTTIFGTSTANGSFVTVQETILSDDLITTTLLERTTILSSVPQATFTTTVPGATITETTESDGVVTTTAQTTIYGTSTADGPTVTVQQTILSDDVITTTELDPTTVLSSYELTQITTVPAVTLISTQISSYAVTYTTSLDGSTAVQTSYIVSTSTIETTVLQTTTALGPTMTTTSINDIIITRTVTASSSMTAITPYCPPVGFANPGFEDDSDSGGNTPPGWTLTAQQNGLCVSGYPYHHDGHSGDWSL